MLAALLVLPTVACAPPDAPLPDLEAGPALALRDVTPLDPVHGAGPPATLILQGDRLVAWVDELPERLEERVDVVDAAGLYVLPGLWNLHTHLAMADAHAPPMMIAHGVTGARDLGGPLDEIEALRDRIEAGELVGPRILHSGPTLNGAQNGSHHRVVANPDEARAAVEELVGRVDFFKTHNATERDTYFALLEAAAGAGAEVVGHVPVTVEPIEACRAGQASVEHIATVFEGTYIARFDGELEAFLAMPDWLVAEGPELVACFAEQQTLFVPTLRAYDYRAHRAAHYEQPDPEWRYVSAEGYAQWRESSAPSDLDRREDIIELRESLVETGIELVRLLQEAGAPVGTGTDLAAPGLLAGVDTHAELRLFARAGLTPRQVLRAATRGPGERSGARPLTGELVAGAPADLVLLRGDAFESLDTLDEIAGVVSRGRHFDREELDAILAGLERAPEPTP